MKTTYKLLLKWRGGSDTPDFACFTFDSHEAATTALDWFGDKDRAIGLIVEDHQLDSGDSTS